jgi:preprotein translocase subunit SecA
MGNSELVQRQCSYSVIDEVDSVLVDESRNPLVISGQGSMNFTKFAQAAKIAMALVRFVHYTVDEKRRSIYLTEEGYEAAEDILQVQDLYDPRNQWASFLINAIKAKEIFLINVNYLVRFGQVVLVDEFTGRVLSGRRWEGGLHQAVECKEGLNVQTERVNVASVSYQNLFRGIPGLSGMSGTAVAESAEFSTIYNLGVVVIPSNRYASRHDNGDVIYYRYEYKWMGVLTDSLRQHFLGRPVLVGTTTLVLSQELASMYESFHIPIYLLNARLSHVETESEIVSHSGRLGSVTISTNMAGRGTDIIMGGNARFMSLMKTREISMLKMYKASQYLATVPLCYSSLPSVFHRGFHFKKNNNLLTSLYSSCCYINIKLQFLSAQQKAMAFPFFRSST